MIDLILSKGDVTHREGELRRTYTALARLPTDRAWAISVKEKKPLRSEQQNRYLWGVCYAELCKVLPGWDAEDVHEYMLGEWSGWERIEGMGRVRLKPMRRSSSLNKQEFADFLAFVQRKAATHGCVIPDAQLAPEQAA